MLKGYRDMTVVTLILTLTLSVPQASRCQEEQIQRLAEKSELIVVAEIIEVQSPPFLFDVWSGPVTVIQRVQYRVEKVLKGNLNEGEINVGHYLVRNSLTADTQRARLSPNLFKKGNELVLFLKEDNQTNSSGMALSGNQTYLSFDENCGAILKDANIIKMVEKIISVSRLEKSCLWQVGARQHKATAVRPTVCGSSSRVKNGMMRRG